TAVMVGVGVRKNHVFDLAGVETKLLHAADDLVLCGIIEQSFENDDAVAADNRPRVMDLRTEKVQIVCDLRGLCVPGIPCRSARRADRRGRGGSSSRRNAEAKESAGPIGPGSSLRGTNKAIDCGRCCLRVCDAVDCEDCHE